jgi:hypothetical protein
MPLPVYRNRLHPRTPFIQTGDQTPKSSNGPLRTPLEPTLTRVRALLVVPGKVLLVDSVDLDLLARRDEERHPDHGT